MTKPIIVVKIRCKLLYVIQVVKKILRFLINIFLASADIKVFGRTYRLGRLAGLAGWPADKNPLFFKNFKI